MKNCSVRPSSQETDKTATYVHIRTYIYTSVGLGYVGRIHLKSLLLETLNCRNHLKFKKVKPTWNLGPCRTPVTSLQSWLQTLKRFRICLSTAPGATAYYSLTTPPDSELISMNNVRIPEGEKEEITYFMARRPLLDGTWIGDDGLKGVALLITPQNQVETLLLKELRGSITSWTNGKAICQGITNFIGPGYGTRCRWGRKQPLCGQFGIKLWQSMNEGLASRLLPSLNNVSFASLILVSR